MKLVMNFKKICLVAIATICATLFLSCESTNVSGNENELLSTFSKEWIENIFSKNEQLAWGEMINHYLENRDQLNLIFLLVDSRHLPTGDDLMMLEWIEHYNIDYYVIATKTDKLKPSQRQKQIDDILECLNIDESRFITFSAENGENKDKIISVLSSLE